MNKIERWFRIIEDHYEFVLNCYDKRISEERIHLIMKRDCESKNHFLKLQVKL